MANLHVAETHRPLEEVVQIAKDIWKEVRADTRPPQAALEHYQDKYGDFTRSFPIVLRVMVHERRFNAKVFAEFLRAYAAQHREPNSSLKLQATYLRLLFEEEHPHVPRATAEKYYQEILEALQKEHESFMKAIESVAASDGEADKRLIADRLKAYLKSQR